MNIMGIDPGKTGAIAILFKPENEYQLSTYLLEKLVFKGFRDLVHEFSITHIFLEKAQAMPGQGISSTANYMRDFGRNLGWIESLMIPHTLVSPATWTTEMHRGCLGKDAKAKSLQAAQRLFPSFNFLASARSSKPHAGYIDAALIAEYGRRILK